MKRTRLIMSSAYRRVLPVIALIFCLFSSAFAYSGGTGESNSPYQISNVSDWNDLMNTAGDWNKYFIMTADVNLAGVALTPIGYFTGIFEGNGHIVRNAVLNMPGSGSVGLFGSIGTGGQVRNLGVKDVNIIGGGSVGGLAGDNDGNITNCYAIGTVTGYSSVGGLVGSNFEGDIINCYAAGTVTGGNSYRFIGGLVGGNYDGGIAYCYATGAVTGDRNVGGLVGGNYDGAIAYCYATGAVTGNNGVGGLVGYNHGDFPPAPIRYCYSTGAVTGNENVGGLVGEEIHHGFTNFCFWDIQTSGQMTSASGTGKTTTEMKMLSTFTSVFWDFTTDDGNPADWIMPENDYPHLAWKYWKSVRIPDVNGMSFEDAADTVKGAGLVMGSLTLTSSQTVPVGYVVSQDPAADSNGTVGITKINLTVFCPNQIDGGSGTETDPYQIRTVCQWLFLTSHSELWNKYFILMNDLDFRNGAISIIGNSSTNFTGVFDGSGRIVRNVVVNMPNSDYVGLFGYVGSGKIRNLGVENVGIIGRYYVGGLAGRIYGGNITNCYVTGTVTGGCNTGGLAGRSNGSGNIIISDCYAGVTIRQDYINIRSSGRLPEGSGGLVGVNYGGITRCYATGPIRRFMGFASGGLVGFNIGVITDCYATGTVFGMGYSNYGPFTSGYIGGLVGCDNRGTITSCYAIGVVLGNGNDTTTGGLIGCKWSGSTTTTASFWDTQTSGQTTSVGGTGKTTAEMKTLSTFTSAGWDFADIWGIGENQTYPFLRKYSLGDLNYDGIVNFVDFALFADGWFEGVQ